MKKYILGCITAILFTIGMSAQIQNAKTETIKIYGNCETCKKTIEKAGNVKDEALVVWNVQSKMATITYDSKKTTLNAILKRVSNAGYDNEKFRGSDKAYKKLPACCQYERKEKTSS